jgi:hypothetical protein
MVSKSLACAICSSILTAGFASNQTINVVPNTTSTESTFTLVQTNGETTSSVEVTTPGIFEIDIAGNLIPSESGGNSMPTLEVAGTTVTTAGEPTTLASGSGEPVNATATKFEQVVDNLGTIRVEVFAIESEGTVGVEDWTVGAGDIKWNVELSGWNFSQTAAFIDFEIAIDGSATSYTELQENTYDVGGGQILLLTSVVEVDGTAKNMPEGFPRLVERDGQQVFVCRFPRFHTSLVYDPLISTTETQQLEPADDNSTANESGNDTDNETGDEGTSTFISGASGRFVSIFTLAILGWHSM